MQNTSSTTKQLYLFLTACSGSWRNSIYIKCQGENDSPGYLLAADRDGQPVILPVVTEIDRQRIENVPEDTRITQHIDAQLIRRNIEPRICQMVRYPGLQPTFFTGAMVSIA